MKDSEIHVITGSLFNSWLMNGNKAQNPAFITFKYLIVSNYHLFYSQVTFKSYSSF